MHPLAARGRLKLEGNLYAEREAETIDKARQCVARLIKPINDRGA
jgi:hypothetical protein